MNTIKKVRSWITNRQPRTLKQLIKRLPVDYVEIFPFGQYKDHLVENVVKKDPNYIVWWDQTIKRLPIEPSIVKTANKNYKPYNRGDWWEYPEPHWDSHDQDW
jgi:hypothetical protein